MLRQLGSLCFAFTFCLAQATAGEAPASRLDAILAAGVLKVGSTGDYKPFTFKDPATGTFTGFDIDQAQSLAAALGVKLEVVPTAWPKLMQDFEAGAFDIAMGGVSVTLDRQKKGLFSIPYMHEGKSPIARCRRQGQVRDLGRYRQAERQGHHQSGRHQREVRARQSQIGRDRRLRRQHQDFRRARRRQARI